MAKEYYNFDECIYYIKTKKNIEISHNFLLDLVQHKEVPYKIICNVILIEYNVLFKYFDILYKKYDKTRLERIKIYHKDMWGEDYDVTTTNDEIVDEIIYNKAYIEFLSKQNGK